MNKQYKPYSLFHFLRWAGGLRPDPDLTAILGGRYRWMIRKSGMTLDRAREACIEEGFLQDHECREYEPTINNLLELIDREARGQRQYRLCEQVDGWRQEFDRLLRRGRGRPKGARDRHPRRRRAIKPRKMLKTWLRDNLSLPLEPTSVEKAALCVDERPWQQSAGGNYSVDTCLGRYLIYNNRRTGGKWQVYLYPHDTESATEDLGSYGNLVAAQTACVVHHGNGKGDTKRVNPIDDQWVCDHLRRSIDRDRNSLAAAVAQRFGVGHLHTQSMINAWIRRGVIVACRRRNSYNQQIYTYYLPRDFVDERVERGLARQYRDPYSQQLYFLLTPGAEPINDKRRATDRDLTLRESLQAAE